MGLLVDGKWKDRWYVTSATGGRFEQALRIRDGARLEIRERRSRELRVGRVRQLEQPLLDRAGVGEACGHGSHDKHSPPADIPRSGRPPISVGRYGVRLVRRMRREPREPRPTSRPGCV